MPKPRPPLNRHRPSPLSPARSCDGVCENIVTSPRARRQRKMNERPFNKRQRAGAHRDRRGVDPPRHRPWTAAVRLL
ncbi:MAG: hypothetical protein HSCHL_1570 [Hydrogenibacillus schlegelii]|uniref:Uncharacterized protein n=1 Tax=Hydrogenibacillus schlegelii TaxID=1484 RepID=A0A2T5GBS2_HYDSH|nr:MAG: hypothetical protein HSCHL_1570 [Hydrogenibacillus schlegelii]